LSFFAQCASGIPIDRPGWLAADFEGNQFTARQLGDYVEVLIRAGSVGAK